MAIMTPQEAMAVMGSPYGKSLTQLKNLYLRHLQEWRPKQYRTLKKENRINLTANRAAQRVYREIKSLRDSGYQNHEAEEIVLPRYILLTPEPEYIDTME